jgi:hypothetical protein
VSTLAGYEALRLCHSNWYFLRIYAFSICFQLICSFFNQLPLFSTHWHRFPSVPRFSAYSGSFVLSGSYIFVRQLFLLHIYTFLSGSMCFLPIYLFHVRFIPAPCVFSQFTRFSNLSTCFLHISAFSAYSKVSVIFSVHCM